MKSEFGLVLWVIYDHPTDFPDYYVARRWDGTVATGDVIMSTTLHGVEDKLTDWGYTKTMRDDKDDPKIMSVWL